MKLFMSIPFALGLAASSLNAQAAPEAPAGRNLSCVFGVPGFIDGDPTAMVMILGLRIPLVPGTNKLTTAGIGEVDQQFPIKIERQIPTGYDRYQFLVVRGPQSSYNVTVSTLPFKGKFAGLNPDLVPDAVAATATLPLNDGSGEVPVVNGFCTKTL